jgi:hypothetical protein
MIILDVIRGLADSKWSGIQGSVYRCCGLDIHSEPGLLKVHQRLTKETSGTEPDEFCKVKVTCSNGYSFWFSSTSGKIWARTSAGVWSLAHTTTGTGDDWCLGAMEYNGFIVWATPSKIHLIAVANADDVWASTVQDWATFTNADTSWHPMCIQDLTLWIGDGKYLASIGSTISATPGTGFTANALDLTSGYRIKCLKKYEEDILIGTFINSYVNTVELIRWDLVSSSWNTSDPIEECGINAFMEDDNYIYVQAGLAGNWYFYNGSQLEPYKRIPGDYSAAKYGEVYPDSVGNFMNRPIFGFSNGAGNPAPQGIYTLGGYSRDYPKVMDLSWVISEATTSSIEIGAVMVAGFTLLVAWKNGDSKGVDAIDWSNKYASAYLETMMLFQDKRDISKTLKKVACFYNSLPASTGITFSYDVNGAGYVAMTSVTNSLLNEIAADLSVGNVGSLQIKVAFTVSSNDAPTLEIPLSIEIDGLE